jgi:hypothetical protein
MGEGVLRAVVGAVRRVLHLAELSSSSHSLDPDQLLLAPRPAPRNLVVDAILGARCGYDPTVRQLTALPHDVLLHIFSSLPARSLCNLGARASPITHAPG